MTQLATHWMHLRCHCGSELRLCRTCEAHGHGALYCPRSTLGECQGPREYRGCTCAPETRYLRSQGQRNRLRAVARAAVA